MSQSSGHEKLQKNIGKLTKRDLFMLGIGLYIGGGGKTTNLVRIINSDPKVIQLAIRWFKKICSLNNENFSIRIHLYPDNNTEDCVTFWRGITGFSRNQFQKTQIDLRTNKKKVNKGKLPYGTAHLTVKSNGRKDLGVFIARRIMGWIHEVTQENARA